MYNVRNADLFETQFTNVSSDLMGVYRGLPKLGSGDTGAGKLVSG
jgi:hypothetical protein